MAKKATKKAAKKTPAKPNPKPSKKAATKKRPAKTAMTAKTAATKPAKPPAEVVYVTPLDLARRAWTGILTRLRPLLIPAVCCLGVLVAGIATGFVLDDPAAIAPGLVSQCRALASGVDSPHRAEGAGAMARALAGVVDDRHDDLMAQFAEARRAVTAALPEADRPPWKPWSAAINLLLWDAHRDGRLVTPADGDVALGKIARGLAMVADGSKDREFSREVAKSAKGNHEQDSLAMD